MASPAVASKFRAVLCRHCAKPIRVPALIMKKESEFQSLTDFFRYSLPSDFPRLQRPLPLL